MQASGAGMTHVLLVSSQVGKTVARLLTDDQLADCQTWFNNQRRLRSLVAELETLSLDIADADPR